MELLDNLPVYVVGRINADSYYKWELQGIYQTESVARDSCRDDTYFYFIMKLNEPAPHETVVAKNAIYPKAIEAAKDEFVKNVKGIIERNKE